uniref:Retrovirus-related Pol polyprotein from transposon TNT 1-94 n=1 Tax=Tanacetum cinerariifolium TaxID=118510 RepID=A0A6L2LK36_TANCI|nr:retrovirus-related Pol polyprotein from transposon TNT 1-94 [Tanacetum cinerariifolium]
MWAEVGEGQLIGPELVQETTEKISQIKDRLKVTRDRQKSYADKKRNLLKFSIGDYVLFKVPPWKGVVRFGKRGKLAPRFVGSFEIIKMVVPVSYRLDLPEELNGVHDTFYVSNLKKCLADLTLQLPLDEIRVDAKLNFMKEPILYRVDGGDFVENYGDLWFIVINNFFWKKCLTDPTLQVPLDEIRVDAKLNFMEKPVEILERVFKKLKRSRIAIVKVRTRQPIAVPISTRDPKRNVGQSVVASHKKTVAKESTVKKPRSIIRKLYENVSKTCSWWYPKFTPSGYKWKPKSLIGNVNINLIEIILFIVDSGCSKYMTGNLKLLSNFMEKFLGTVKFGNDQIALILGYGYLVQGKITIKRVYYVEGLNHNLFSVGQFYDADLKVAFWKSTCYICDLKGNDILTGSRGTDLYSITLQDISTPNLICLMAKVTSSQAWLWHRRLLHLNFDTINLLSKNDIVIGLQKLKFIKDDLCSSCELGKAKQKSFHTKTILSSKKRLQILHMDLCGPMRVERFNDKKYMLVIVDDYSRYTCTHFLRFKDETTEVLIDFLRLFQRGLHAQVRTVQTDKGTKFLNKTLHTYFAKEGIRHQTVFYSAKSLRVFNKRTRVILETIHVNFDELPQMASDHVCCDPVPQCSTTELKRDSLSPGPQSQENVPQASETVTMSNELDLLFSLMFDELLNGTSTVSKSFVENAANALDKRQNKNITPSTTTVATDTPPLIIQTTHETTNQVPNQTPTVTATENINQAKTNKENAQVKEDEFINIFSTPVQEQRETSSRHVDSSNMHTLYQQHPSEHRWTKDNPLEQVIRNPSQSIRTRR